MEDIIRGKWEEFKALFEMLAVANVRYGCFCYTLHEVGNKMRTDGANMGC